MALRECYTVISPLSSPMADRSETPAVPTSQASNVLTTKVDPTSARFEANMRFLADLMSQVRNEGEKICEGGGAKAIENQHAKGRLTARERIELLIDPGTFFELGLYAAYGMYEEWGGAAGRRRDHRYRASSDAHGDDHRERCHGESGRIFPHDLEESDSRPEHRHREPHPDDLSGGFGGRFPAAAGRCFSRHRRLRARLPQQRRHVGAGHSADRGHHGHVRGRRRIPASDVRSRSDDRWQRIISRRSGAGAGGNRTESFGGRSGRCGHARRHQRHGGFPRTGRSRLPRAHSLDRGKVGIPTPVSLGSQEAGRTGAGRRGNLRHLRFLSRASLRHERDSGARARWQPLRRVQARVRQDSDLRLRTHRRLCRGHCRQPEDCTPIRPTTKATSASSSAA